MCLGTYSGDTCARADAPLNTWIKFLYTYHPNASPRGNVRVEYTSSSGAVIVWTATNNKMENNFGTRKIAFGTSVSANCAGYPGQFVQLYANSCKRPIFDTAGFIFLFMKASEVDISTLLQAIADGVKLQPRVSPSGYIDFYVRQECNASRDVICQECQACGPASYDNNTCGASYGNDRLDTQCALCPADSYEGTLTIRRRPPFLPYTFMCVEFRSTILPIPSIAMALSSISMAVRDMRGRVLNIHHTLSSCVFMFPF